MPLATTQDDDATLPEPEPWEAECLVCYLARVLDERECDHTLRWSRRYRDLRVPGATGLAARLARVGAACDGAVLDAGWWPARVHWERDLGTDELRRPRPLPGCEGVGATSARPCRLWVRPRAWDLPW